MLSRLRQKEPHFLIFLILFALIFSRYCLYGFQYYYQLDDYIQYHNYTAGESPWDVVMRLGMLAARPLAGLADVFVWEKFFSVMILGVAVVSAMFAGSACFLKKVFERNFGTGYVFLIVYTLLPLGFEGTYWMSASTRIVSGLFFSSAALLAFDTWCSGGKKVTLAAYCALQILAYGFYEQAIAFSAASVILIGLLNLKGKPLRSVWMLWSFVAAACYFAFVNSFPESALYGTKTEYILPNTPYYFDVFLPELLGQLKSAFLGGGYYTLTRGFVRGAKLIVRESGYVYLIAAIFLAAAVFFLARSFKAEKRRKPATALTIGVLLIAAPLAPFFFAANTWFSFRGTVFSFCGIGLVADTVISLLLSRFHSGRKITAAFCAVFALWCCVCSVSEIHDYKATMEKDHAVTSLIMHTLIEDGHTDAEQSVAILNLEPTYLEEQNSYYHEHIHGVTESSWALSGALEWMMGAYSPEVAPLPANPMYRGWNRESMLLYNFEALYLYDGEDTLIKVSAVNAGYNMWTLKNENGEELGFVREEDNCGYLQLTSSAAETSSAPS